MCVCCRNLNLLSEALASSAAPPDLIINISETESVTVEMYKQWYSEQGRQLNLTGFNISNCSLEDAMNKVCVCVCVA